jgi:cob(I)alamin adenosyltransferase
MLEKIMILVITGNGKGKTTSSIGQIIRALGHNQKVCLVQLFKGENFYGEQNILTKLEGLDFFSFAKQHPFCFKEVSKEKVIWECEQSLNKLQDISQNNKYNLIVLEEFNIAIRDNFIDETLFIDIIKKLNKKSNIVITGRGASQKLINIADLVSEIKEVKHPYNEGVPAQEGIEY